MQSLKSKVRNKRHIRRARPILFALMALCAIQLASLLGPPPVSASSSAASAGDSRWHFNEDEFLANTVGPNYSEDFNDHGFGFPLSGDPVWEAPGANGFGWTASADEWFGGPLLFSIPGALSTSDPLFPFRITFTGNPVTAFGGWFAATDIDGSVVQASEVTITLSSGKSFRLIHGDSEYRFLGWTGTTPIESIEIGWARSTFALPFPGGHNLMAFWPAVTRFIIGTSASE